MISSIYFTSQFCHSEFYLCFFFFTVAATTEIYTLSLHDALPISAGSATRPTTASSTPSWLWSTPSGPTPTRATMASRRSEEHTSELQSQSNLVCRLLLEKKKKKDTKSQLLNYSHYTIYDAVFFRS